MTDTIFANQATLWMVLGFVLLVIELVGFGLASGFLLFGSLGALLTGMLMWLEVIPNNYIVGISCFAISTIIVTALLWVPLRKLQSGAELGNDRSSDLIGHTFTVESEITSGQHGTHKYSGINWRVEPSIELKQPSIQAGTPVKVTAVKVGVFFVEPV